MNTSGGEEGAGGGFLYSKVSCLEGGLEPGWESMYGEVQCIMGYGHMRPSCGQTDTTENNTFPQLRWWSCSRRPFSRMPITCLFGRCMGYK